MLVVGSIAAKKWGINRGEPNDRDVWITREEEVKYLTNTKVDYHVIPKEIIKAIPRRNCMATADALYTIKCSHFQWDIHWEKTKADILYMKSKGCKLIPSLYETLVRYWRKEHGDKSFLSLKRKKEEFFNDHVKYKYDHDFLHEVVALPNKPVYTHCLKDNEDVLIDEDKFLSLPFDQQVKMFKEEITVIACERWLLNERFKGSWLEAYMMSLKKTLTNLTKGWASDFIIMNLEHFIKPDIKMFNNLYNNLEELIMSKVDLTVFQELASTTKEGLDYTIYCLAAGGEIYGDFEKALEELDYEHIDSKGGYEGGGEYCYGVFKLKGRIYKAEWTYYSYNGSEYEGIANTLREVKPVEKVVTVYE